jgi:hypothetical protein
MEEGRARLDLSGTAWSRGSERERWRLLAAAALGLCVREGRETSHVRGPWPLRPGK